MFRPGEKSGTAVPDLEIEEIAGGDDTSEIRDIVSKPCSLPSFSREGPAAKHILQPHPACDLQRDVL